MRAGRFDQARQTSGVLNGKGFLWQACRKSDLLPRMSHAGDEASQGGGWGCSSPMSTAGLICPLALRAIPAFFAKGTAVTPPPCYDFLLRSCTKP